MPLVNLFLSSQSRWVEVHSIQKPAAMPPFRLSASASNFPFFSLATTWTTPMIWPGVPRKRGQMAWNCFLLSLPGITFGFWGITSGCHGFVCFRETNLEDGQSISLTLSSWTLRACPREDQAGVAHAISPIFLKLGLVKGFTQKLHRPKPFDLWILPSEYRPPPLVFQGKPLKTHQNMAVKLEALLLLLFSRFYFYLAWALVDPLLVHSESFASRGLILVNQCQSIVDHVMT